ncbi:MAG: phage tail protein [Anaerolineae bacterium]|nr:phage tail protein [Anaerolineae bacterium]
MDFDFSPAFPAESPNRIYGMVIGIVTNNKDPDGKGRVKLRFPWLADNVESNWARIASPMAGKERGFYFLPEVDDEVLVAFEHGQMEFPYVLGVLWNGKDAPPEKNDDGKNNRRVIKSRSGHIIRLDDKDGEEKIEILDKSGKNSVVIDTKAKTITISAEADIVLKSADGKLVLQAAKGVEVKSDADIKVEAGGKLDLKASGDANVKGATVNLN